MENFGIRILNSNGKCRTKRGLEFRRCTGMMRGMNLTLPDVPITRQMGDAQLRLELACALYAQGKVTRVSGAELAGVDFFSFQKALGERRISTCTLEDLHDDVKALDRLFSKGAGEADKG